MRERNLWDDEEKESEHSEHNNVHKVVNKNESGNVHFKFMNREKQKTLVQQPKVAKGSGKLETGNEIDKNIMDFLDSENDIPENPVEQETADPLSK
mmetsp:Transcript_10991/g.24178  ORF Transcript_10991/g.24178 Transcript_10991/m.24178 type:complete len:96 (-) Transcript_10991:334-621(-)